MNSTQQLQLSDNLTVNTVQEILNGLSSQLALQSASNIVLDLSKVRECDTAGLAMLIDVKKVCLNLEKSLQFVNLPKRVASLAKFCDVYGIFEQDDE